jgi:hypothetical protein
MVFLPVFLLLLYAELFLCCSAERVCRLRDLEANGKNAGWKLDQSCTVIDLEDVVVESEVNGLHGIDGKPFTAKLVLERLFGALHSGSQLGSQIQRLNLAGCGLRDSNVLILARILAEDTKERRIMSNQRRVIRDKRNDNSYKRHEMVFGNLVDLNLERNKFTDNGINKLFSILSGDKTSVDSTESIITNNLPQNMARLASISLRHNDIGITGVDNVLKWSSISGIHVKHIDLRDNRKAWNNRFTKVALDVVATTKVVSTTRNMQAFLKDTDPRLHWVSNYDLHTNTLNKGRIKVLIGPIPRTSRQKEQIDMNNQKDSHRTLRTDVVLGLVHDELRYEYGDDTDLLEDSLTDAIDTSNMDINNFPIIVGDKGSLHVDDVGNTVKHSIDRKRKEGLMNRFLNECFNDVNKNSLLSNEKQPLAIPGMEDTTEAALILNRLGHGTPRALLSVDYDDLRTHLPLLSTLHYRYFLRCICEYNFYYEEMLIILQKTSSIDHHDDTQDEIDIRKSMDHYLKRNGKNRINAQISPNIHNDIHTRSSSSISTINKQYSNKNQIKLQLSKYRNLSSKIQLDTSGTAGMVSGNSLSGKDICATQYYRKPRPIDHIEPVHDEL